MHGYIYYAVDAFSFLSLYSLCYGGVCAYLSVSVGLYLVVTSID